MSKRMNTIKFIVVVSIALLSFDLIYHQVVNGSSDKREEELMNEYIEQRKRTHFQLECARFDGSWNQSLDACIMQDGRILLRVEGYYSEELSRIQSQEACSIIKGSWNQSLDACMMPDGRIVLKVKKFD